MKIVVLLLFVASVCHVHLRGRVRHGIGRQLKDHSTFLAPINSLLYLSSRLPGQAYYSPQDFPELGVLQENWQSIRHEALQLREAGRIRKADGYNDAGFNSFFKTGWKRFYLKWYGDSHPSAAELCPQTTALVKSIPQIKAAMFAELPPGARLVRHRDPYAGSLRYHLGLVTPNSDECFIEVDGERYFWRDGEAVLFDETFIHYAENKTEQDRVILFCDVERPLRYRWAAALNRWFSRNVMAAASSPNDEQDATGGINRAFQQLYRLRLRAKALKKRNRSLYYGLQWLLLAVVIALFIWI
ncbi:lipid A hydroxylase LpxO [Pseudomonas sp. ML96]|uniref:lipid A hydroxylase LpxO n=1 Tax=Pseudomonas sp. ML96 TaxID=1523503 RepID=UPI0005B81E0C|nr:lipid A hydroxylase LpxO [Pseudomonas sp. ML96]